MGGRGGVEKGAGKGDGASLSGVDEVGGRETAAERGVAGSAVSEPDEEDERQRLGVEDSFPSSSLHASSSRAADPSAFPPSRAASSLSSSSLSSSPSSSSSDSTSSTLGSVESSSLWILSSQNSTSSASISFREPMVRSSRVEGRVKAVRASEGSKMWEEKSRRFLICATVNRESVSLRNLREGNERAPA